MIPIKILYDISVLGLARCDNRARTGVYRVVENVAVGVARSPACSIRFCSSYNFNRECQDALCNHPMLLQFKDSFLEDTKDLFRNPEPVQSLWQRFLRLVQQNHSGIVYHSLYYPVPEQLRNIKRVGKVQTVYDLIEILFPEYFDYSENVVTRMVLDSLTPESHVICISESTKNDLCAHAKHVDPDNVHVTHLAASSLFYRCLDAKRIVEVRKKFQIPDGMRYLLSVCTLEPRKNLEQTIRTFAAFVLQESLPDLCLVLTGTKGWKYDRIFSNIMVATEVRERIILTGYVPDEDLAPLYSGALAFVYPSLYEGFGLPPLEAMQCGTPVITSNTSSLPEVVGDAGIMVNPSDGDALCQAMLNVYQDDELCQELSVRALERSKLFSWEKCVLETVNVYREALACV